MSEARKPAAPGDRTVTLDINLLGRDYKVACKEHELQEFEYSISDLEYNWYLHTV